MSLGEGFRVRPMAAADLDRVVALERGSESAPHWTLGEYKRCMENSGESAMRRFALVAELDGGFAGFAVVRILAVGEANEAELESIVVSPELRERGVGAGLMAALLTRLRECGVGQLELEVRASHGAAIRLYERLGMVETGHRRGYYRDPVEDAVLMSVRL